MTPRRRRAAAVLATGTVAGALGLALVAPLAAAAPDPPWSDSAWSDGLVDGASFTGATVTFAGDFVYDDSADFDPAAITDVELVLQPVAAGACTTAQRHPVHVGEGDGDLFGDPGGGEPTTVTTGTTTPTTPPTGIPTTTTIAEGASAYHFEFTLVPACNGTYDVTATATVDPGGPRSDEDSSPLRLHGVVVDLHPGSVPSVTATLNPDKSSTVTWTAPAGYGADAAPTDFIGYRVQRSAGSGAWVNLGNVAPAVLTFTDPLTNAPPSIYRYRVFAIRNGAVAGTYNTSALDAAVIAQVSIGGTPSPPTTRRSSTPRTTPSRGGGVPVSTGPTTTIDEGFDSTLPFDPDADLVFGPEDPVLPDDASGLLDIDSGDDPGAGVAVPVAVGSVIVVWALHLRLLTRRATEPA